jgi:hypothetical protein
MKYIKMMGLAVVAALALMAMVGVGSASASGTACKTNTSPCGSPYPVGTKLSGSLATGHATLTTSLGNVTCTTSTVSGVLTSSPVAHGEITGLTFTNCHINGQACEVKAENLPYTVTGVATGGGNGDLTITPKAGGLNPGATVVCPSAFINCTFSKSHIVLKVTGGTPATVFAEKVALDRTGGFCPSTSTWDAHYSITTPSPLFLTV